MGFANRSWGMPKWNLDTLKTMPNASFVEDHVNGYVKVVYCKMSKSKVVGHIRTSYYNQGKWTLPAVIVNLNNDTIKIMDSSLLDMSAQTLHWFLGHWCPGGEYSDKKGRWCHYDGFATLKKKYGRIQRPNQQISWKSAGYLEFFDKTPHEKKMVFDGMIINSGLDILNKPTKIQAKEHNQIMELSRLTTNRNRRSAYHNRKAMIRLKYAQKHGDWSVVEMEDVFKLRNVSERRAVIAHFSMDTILASLHSKELDKDTIDDRPYSLVQVKIPDNSNDEGFRFGSYLRMTNPSTDEIHFEGVPNPIQNVRQSDTTNGWNDTIDEPTVRCALAWRDNDLDMKYIEPKVLT
jgi:hypothetical protein